MRMTNKLPKMIYLETVEFAARKFNITAQYGIRMLVNEFRWKSYAKSKYVLWKMA